LPSEFCAWQPANTGVRLISITLELGTGDGNVSNKIRLIMMPLDRDQSK